MRRAISIAAAVGMITVATVSWPPGVQAVRGALNLPRKVTAAKIVGIGEPGDAAASNLLASQAGVRAAAPQQGRLPSKPISVATAFSLCHTLPTSQQQLWIRGWFVPSIGASRYTEGGFFNSKRAVPNTTAERWDVNGKWRRYGALYVHITTEAAFGPRRLTLHGRLDCTSYRFWSDRDPFPPPHLTPVYGTSGTNGSGAIRTWVTAGGLKLTLVVPRRSYPLNALTKVQVSIQNVSNHQVGYWIPGISLVGFASPQAQVLNQSGQMVFPPAMPAMPPLPGPAPALLPLRPGNIVTASEYIVVRGPIIRASQAFTPTWSSTVRRAPNTLLTHSVSVRLTSEPAPRLTVHQKGGEPTVDVLSPAGVSGPMLKLSYVECGTSPNGPNFEYTFGWVASARHLVPTCSPVKAWHLRVAWLNHPVASLDYVVPQPGQVPTILPSMGPPPTPPSAGSVSNQQPPDAHPTATPPATPTPQSGPPAGNGPTPTPVTGETIFITPYAGTPPQWVPVGGRIVLTASGTFPVILNADPTYLVLEDSGQTGSARYWRYRAVRDGTTSIAVSPGCATHGCALPSWAIKVVIGVPPQFVQVTHLVKRQHL